MGVTNYKVAITTDSGGAATAYTQMPVTGLVEWLRYHPDGTNPLDTGADLVITGESSGIAIATLGNIGTSAFTKAPRQPTHDVAAGAAITYDGTHAVNEKIALSGERIKVAVAQGGNTLSGTLEFAVSDT
jgi:hypothetical protein